MRERPSIFRSIRLRLTIWQVVLMLLSILLLGAAVSYLAERELRRNVDRRLERTAADMTSQFSVEFNFTRPVVVVPPPGAFSFPSLLVQVVDSDGTIWFSSENVGDRRIPIDPGTFDSSDVKFSSATVDGVNLRIISDPIVFRNGRVIGAVVVAEPLLQLTETLSDLRQLFLLAAILGALLAAMTGWFISGRALKPVDQMTRTARSLAAGGEDVGLEARLDVPSTKDELARLASTFNDLLAKLEASVDTQRRFVADASHELRTPLTAIRGNIDLLDKQIAAGTAEPFDIDETLSELRRESERMSRLVNELLTLARSESIAGLPLQCERLDVMIPVFDAIRTANSLGTGHEIHLHEPDDAVVAEIDRDRIHQVVLILLENAIRETDRYDPIEVFVERSRMEFAIRVSDMGKGLDPADIPRLFDRFSRADESRVRVLGGTGLGLAIAKAIVEAHNGTIAARSSVAGGATFPVHIPMSGGCTSEVGSDALGKNNSSGRVVGAVEKAVTRD